MLAGICILLLACSEQEENESLYAGMGKEKVDVRLSLSSLPKIQVEGNTDYHPMSGRAEAGEIRSIIANRYNCLVMKEIGEKWYVDTLVRPALTQAGIWSDVKVTDATIFNDVQLTLRPGHYRVLVVLNPGTVEWNASLKPGAVVKGGADTVAHAYTYHFQRETSWHANYGMLQVNREVFAGSVEFTVEKTSDLHSNPINGNTHITLARKVMQLRFLLKDNASPKEGFNFNQTQHTVHTTLKATQPDTPFCDGLDCWGNAYYNSKVPTEELQLCTDIHDKWRLANNGIQYKMTSPPNVTIYSPFIFADNTREVPYQLKNTKVVGQSGQGGYVYIYPQFISGLVVKNNIIQPFVFQTTDEVDPDIAEPQLQVTLEYLPDEALLNLFDDYYECNIP